jgi:hypothetical protein
MTKEALDLALEVLQINLTLLEKINPYKGQEDLLSDSLELTHKAITAINQARSAPMQPVGTYGEIHKSMQALLRSGLQRDQYIYMAMEDKPLYATLPTAQPAPVQEPVACGYDETTGNCTNSPCCYTTPPAAQRPWVGLTHDEYDAICDRHSAMSDFDFLEDIEAKLKELNT